MQVDYFDIKKEDLEGFYHLIPNDLIMGEHLRYVGAIDEEEYAAGILVWHINKGYIQIDHLAVDEIHLSTGIAKGMVDYLMEKLASISEFATIIAIYMDTPQYEAFNGFINSNEDFVVVESSRFHIIDKKTRDESELYQKLKGRDYNTISFAELSDSTRRRFYRQMDKLGVHLFSKDDEKELLPRVSRCVVHNGEVSAVVLVSLNNLKELDISFVYCRPRHGIALGICLAQTIDAIEKYYPEKNIVFSAENPQSIKLSQKLFGENIQDVAVYTAVSFGKIAI